MVVLAKPAPACLEERHLQYLDLLSQSGTEDMYGAAPRLEAEFDLTRLEAADVLVHWWAVANRHPQSEAQRFPRTRILVLHQGGAALPRP